MGNDTFLLSTPDVQSTQLLEIWFVALTPLVDYLLYIRIFPSK